MTYDYAVDLFLIIFLSIMLLTVIIAILTLIGEWKVFQKAGKPGWAAIVPIYNNIVMLEITELPTWYIILYFIPFANIYVQVVTYIELAKKFNASSGFAIGLLFLPYVFFPILGGKNYEYQRTTSKFCPNCGTKLDGHVNFCFNCGHKFN